MKIVSLKKNVCTNENFVHDCEEFPYLEGISINLTMTKDGHVILYDHILNSNETLALTQDSLLKDLKAITIKTLEEFLNLEIDPKKKIIIQLLPLISPSINESNLEMINQSSEYFVKQVYKIIQKFPKLDISLASSSRRLLYYLVQNKKHYALGLILKSDDLSYQDLDFYIFNSDTLDLQIMKQQLDFNKKIMLYLMSTSDISLFMKTFSAQEKSPNQKIILENLYIITPYPDIIKQLI